VQRKRRTLSIIATLMSRSLKGAFVVICVLLTATWVSFLGYLIFLFTPPF
jgi:hypothetical protein